MSLLTKIFGDENKNYFKKLQPSVDAINGLEKDFQAMEDNQLKAKTAEFKDRLAKWAVLDDL
jgi:preprotein translocase subunit SecA